MIKNILFLFLVLSIGAANAGLPPTTSKGTGDTTDVVTFTYRFSGFPISHSGTIATISPPASSFTQAVVTKTANYTITTSDDVVIANTSGGSFTLTLPASNTASRPVYIKMASGSIYPLTIARGSSDTIDGETTQTLTTPYQSIILIPDGGTSWYVF